MNTTGRHIGEKALREVPRAGRRSTGRWSVCWPVLLLALMLAGCDNTLTPVLDQTEELFIVHGFLDSAADTQFVRLAPIRPTILPDETAPFDATVRSIHEETGTVMTWTSEPILLEDSTVALRFYAPFAPVAGGTYRLEVTRPDGAAMRAIARMPVPPALGTGPVEGGAAVLQQTVTLLGLTEKPHRLEMVYDLSVPGTPAQTLGIDYGQRGTAAAAGWTLPVFLKRDQETLLFRLRRDVNDRTIRLHRLGLRVDMLSPEWAMPDAEANIENGHGFFGAIGRYLLPWTLDEADVHAIGFVDEQR